jgi:DNA-binding CsgD family transcriptional regulator
MRMGRRHNLSSSVMSLLADVLFAYMDELASLSQDGYLEAKAKSAGALEEWRRRLLHLILERPTAPPSAIAELASLAGWTVPEEVTLVAVPAGTKCARPLLDNDVLVALRGIEPHLLFPGPLDEQRRAGLTASMPVGRIAVGVTVPIAQAPDSLRWARQALEIASTGVLGGDRVTVCADHLPTLWLQADNALVDQIARRRFAALEGLTPKQRERLMETLGAWLDTRGSAAEIADRLHVHPQTVRYRMRQMEKTFGDELADPDTRFAMELVLRASRLRAAQQTREAVLSRATRGGGRSRAS